MFYPPDSEFYSGNWQGGRALGFQSNELPDVFSLCQASSKKVRRVAHGSFGGETCWGIESLEEGYGLCMMIDEAERGRQYTMEEKIICRLTGNPVNPEPMCKIDWHTDCGSVIKALNKLVLSDLSKRRKCDVSYVKQEIKSGRMLPVTKIRGEQNPVDSISKDFSAKGTTETRRRLRDICEFGIYEVI